MVQEIESPIILVDVDMLSTGEQFRGERLDHPDLVDWDIAAHRNHWPDKAAAESLWASYVAYSCLTRLGRINHGMAFEAFRRTARVGLRVEAGGVNPTQSDPEPDSALS